MRKILLIMVFVNIINILLSDSSATVSYVNTEFKWIEMPYLQNKNYVVNYEGYRKKGDGFDIFILKSNQESNWHIQVVSKSSIKLDKTQYVIEFQASSNNEFELHLSMVAQEPSGKQTFKDAFWPVIGDGKWHRYHFQFEGEGIENFLNFQLGYAPSGTLFKTRKITLRPIDREPVISAPAPPSGLKILK